MTTSGNTTKPGSKTKDKPRQNTQMTAAQAVQRLNTPDKSATRKKARLDYAKHRGQERSIRLSDMRRYFINETFG